MILSDEERKPSFLQQLAIEREIIPDTVIDRCWLVNCAKEEDECNFPALIVEWNLSLTQLVSRCLKTSVVGWCGQYRIVSRILFYFSKWVEWRKRRQEKSADHENSPLLRLSDPLLVQVRRLSPSLSQPLSSGEWWSWLFLWVWTWVAWYCSSSCPTLRSSWLDPSFEETLFRHGVHIQRTSFDQHRFIRSVPMVGSHRYDRWLCILPCGCDKEWRKWTQHPYPSEDIVNIGTTLVMRKEHWRTLFIEVCWWICRMRMISIWWMKDGFGHCLDGSGETNFVSMELNECNAKTEYRCRNELCLPRSFLLERPSDCPD